jgi:hypothetical protein
MCAEPMNRPAGRTDETLPPPVPVGEPTRLEVIMSLVIPGAGQFAQRRWIAASWQIAAAGILAIIVTLETFGSIFKLFNILLGADALDPDVELPRPSFKVIFTSLGLFLVLQVVSLIDAAIAYRRRLLEWKQARRKTEGTTAA